MTQSAFFHSFAILVQSFSFHEQENGSETPSNEENLASLVASLRRSAREKTFNAKEILINAPF